MAQKHYNLELFYPYNDVRTKEAMEKILDNLHSIPVEELEKLTEKII
jgi:hypothetical protein